jgi:hypothetical protein
MASFEIHGPFEIDFAKKKGGRVLVFDGFWKEDSDAHYLANERGCYVFAIRNKALTPIYVGKATKTFCQETFNPTNKHKYHDGFSEYGKGTPVMFFVVHPKQKGPTNGTYVGEIEDFLIQAGVVKNPHIQNIRGSQQPKWSIKGIVRSGGKRTKAAGKFAKMFDIKQ